VRLLRTDITRVDENASGLIVRTADRVRSVWIPIELDPANYQFIRSQLSAWTTVGTAAASEQALGLLMVVVVLGGMGLLFLSANVWVIGVTAGVLTVILAYSFWQLRRNPNLDPRSRRSLIFTLFFPVLLATFKICILMGGYVAFMEWAFGGLR
jgi:hypothetical protein